MKINDRTLIHIAQSAENPVDQSGWLLKLSEDKKAFHRRWCVLKENLFFYYESRTDKEPLGAIILEGYRVEIVENSNSDHFAFKIDFGVSQFGLQLKSYTFAAENHSDMERWIKVISCASYDYLKSVVSELQHRLDELSRLKLREPMAELTKKSLKEDPLKRFNPFDSAELHEPVQALTFMDLHEKYGRIVRTYFQTDDNVTDDLDLHSQDDTHQKDKAEETVTAS